MRNQPSHIKVTYIPSSFDIVVLSDFLRINYTKKYVKSLTGLTEKQSKRVLHWLGKMFDEDEGINTKVIRKIGEGVRSELL